VNPICAGNSLSPLPTTSLNGITGSWSPTLDNTQTKTYTFIPNTGQCALNTLLIITVNSPTIVATFASSVLTICDGDTLTALPITSTNGITGSWSPALDNTQTKTYTFLPNTGQCALGNTFIINVTPKKIPTFNPVNPICAGGLLNALPTTSLEGITGSWSPAVNNMQTQTYIFQPDPNQCATTANQTITIIQPTEPIFVPIAPVCVGTIINPLPSTSLNGITGTWSPAFDNRTSQFYIFTPNTPQCALSGSLNITVAPNPAFTDTAYICFDAFGQLVNPANIDTGLSSSDYSFVWIKDGDVNPLSNISPFFQATQVGIYKVTATNFISNCTITIETTVLASPVATALAYVNEDFADVQQIIVEVTGGLGDFLYQLNYGPFQPSNVFTITEGGDYTIHVKDLSGCNTFELQVTALNFPKFFTPNDDGYNDTWNVDGFQPGQQGLISIFDRYGKLLKQITAHGEGWDGTFNGNRLPSTDYWFSISYRSILGVLKTFRSHFSLKR
jgi:gliding motility-associated-like protein